MASEKWEFEFTATEKRSDQFLCGESGLPGEHIFIYDHVVIKLSCPTHGVTEVYGDVINAFRRRLDNKEWQKRFGHDLFSDGNRIESHFIHVSETWRHKLKARVLSMFGRSSED